jgi:hypothetical protein
MSANRRAVASPASESVGRAGHSAEEIEEPHAEEVENDDHDPRQHPVPPSRRSFTLPARGRVSPGERYSPVTNATYVTGQLFPPVPGMVQMVTEAAQEG